MISRLDAEHTGHMTNGPVTLSVLSARPWYDRIPGPVSKWVSPAPVSYMPPLFFFLDPFIVCLGYRDPM